jgi:hypothetical protein
VLFEIDIILFVLACALSSPALLNKIVDWLVFRMATTTHLCLRTRGVVRYCGDGAGRPHRITHARFVIRNSADPLDSIDTRWRSTVERKRPNEVDRRSWSRSARTAKHGRSPSSSGSEDVRGSIRLSRVGSWPMLRRPHVARPSTQATGS